MEPERGKTAPSKEDRLRELFRRMGSAAKASTFEEAFHMLCETLDQVEDELSGLPNKPEPSMTLDRMFPPQADRISTVEGYDLKRLDSLRHITYIAGNGAMEIRLKRRPKDGSDVAQFSKPGADGRSISDICPELAAKNL